MKQFAHRHLLRRLHAKIRQPILPGDEREYLTTQVLAEYLATVLVPSIDGLLFSSVQREDGLILCYLVMFLIFKLMPTVHPLWVRNRSLKPAKTPSVYIASRPSSTSSTSKK